MTTYTPATLVGAELMDAMSPWLTLELAWYLDGIGAMFEQVAQLTQQIDVDGTPDYVPPYGSVFDPATSTQLAYLGNFVGVPIPPDATDAQARSLITSEQGMKRGTPASIIAAAKTQLTGTKSVTLLERERSDGSVSGYSFVLIVNPAELVDATLLTAAVNTVKPAGLIWFLVQSSGWTILSMEAGFATIALLEAAFTTVGNLEIDRV